MRVTENNLISKARELISAIEVEEKRLFRAKYELTRIADGDTLGSTFILDTLFKAIKLLTAQRSAQKITAIETMPFTISEGPKPKDNTRDSHLRNHKNN